MADGSVPDGILENVLTVPKSRRHGLANLTVPIVGMACIMDFSQVRKRTRTKMLLAALSGDT